MNGIRRKPKCPENIVESAVSCVHCWKTGWVPDEMIIVVCVKARLGFPSKCFFVCNQTVGN